MKTLAAVFEIQSSLCYISIEFFYDEFFYNENDKYF